jgi:hypothetical protein
VDLISKVMQKQESIRTTIKLTSSTDEEVNLGDEFKTGKDMKIKIGQNSSVKVIDYNFFI